MKIREGSSIDVAVQAVIAVGVLMGVVAGSLGVCVGAAGLYNMMMGALQ